MPQPQPTAVSLVADAAPLRLQRVDLFAVSIPLSRPMKMAGVVVTSADNLFVRIETADGHVGWGEAASAPAMTATHCRVWLRRRGFWAMRSRAATCVCAWRCLGWGSRSTKRR